MENENHPQDESYQVHYTAETTDFLDSRRAATHAAFFLPYLRSGMTLLDCGCGPGSITVDLAEVVAPAEVLGIDIDERHLRLAKDYALETGVKNVRFKTGDVTQLDFPNESFDAVFVHGVIEYVDAERALSEIHRVLKRGGVLGSRHGDWGGFLIAPESRALTEFIELFTQLVQHNGGDPHFGRNQFAAMRRVGFADIQVSASYDCWTKSRKATQSAANMLATYCTSSEFADPIVKLGFTDRSRLGAIESALREWGEDENAFAAEAWGEAVGWKR